MNGKKKKSYSSLQYFFWLLAGSEISILKKCPTDYNRHASIGFTIFMTCVFAFAAGSYAGYYFSHSILGGIIFGIIWTLLVFSIDRSMVISIKKDPTKAKQPFWIPFMSRALLAGVIAFIISIPLELLVFQDNININIEPYKIAKRQELHKNKAAELNVAADSGSVSNLSSELSGIEQELRDGPNTAEFRELASEVQTVSESRSLKSKELNRARADVRSLRNMIPKKEKFDNEGNISYSLDKNSSRYFTYLAANKNLQRLQRELNIIVKNQSSLLNKKREVVRIFNEDKDQQKGKTRQALTDASSKLRANQDSIDKTKAILDSKMKAIDQSFIVRYDILSFSAYKQNAAGALENPSILFFLWLIRILFFLFEILPTVSKISTPVGAYDWAIYQAEHDFREIKLKKATQVLTDEMNLLYDLEKKEKERQRRYRLTREGELHDELVEEIILKQNRMARRILDDWEKQHKNEELLG